MAGREAFAKLLATTLACVAVNGAATPITKRAWQPVEGAAYYEGTVAAPGRTSRIRTTSHWLLLPAEDKLAVEARSFDGRSLGPVRYATEPADSGDAAPVVIGADAPPPVDADPFAEGDLGD